LLGADEISPADLNPEAFVIYIGHHGDRGAQLADLVLPGCAYTEKNARWMNMEGKIQSSRTAVPPPGNSRPDWQIIRALAEVAGIELGVEGQAQIDLSIKEKPSTSILNDLKDLAKKNYADARQIMRSPIRDYYLTDCISRASPTMASCSQQFTAKQ
jgi:NADH dehydrogenase (ubiquinone) Fe-S protein 1